MNTERDHAAWQEACTPGPQHEALKKFVGKWKKEMVMRRGVKENAQPLPPGEAVMTMIHDGRYLKTEEIGVLGGKPYTGLGLIGYDNYKGKYTLFWCDNIGTSMSFSYGIATADGMALVFHGTLDEPMTGERENPIRLVYRWADENTLMFEIWSRIGTPGEFMPVEIKYSRL